MVVIRNGSTTVQVLDMVVIRNGSTTTVQVLERVSTRVVVVVVVVVAQPDCLPTLVRMSQA